MVDHPVLGYTKLKQILRKEGSKGQFSSTKGFFYKNGIANKVINSSSIINKMEVLSKWSYENGELEGSDEILIKKDYCKVSLDKEKVIRQASWAPSVVRKNFENVENIYLKLIRLENVSFVLGDKGFVIFRDGVVLKESAGLPNFTPNYSTPVELIESGFFCGGRIKFDNIFHALLDDFARGWWYKINKKGDAPLFFPDYTIDYCKTTLKEVFPDFKSLCVGVVYKFKELILLSNSINGIGSPMIGMDSNYLTWITGIFNVTDGKKSDLKKIYVSRKDSRQRIMKNESKLEQLLTSFGFVAVVMSDYTPREQMELFAGAETIIAPHGAALTNLIFSRSELTLIEIFSPHRGSIAYAVMAEHFGFKYIPLVGKFPIQSNIKGEWLAPMGKIEVILENVKA